MASQRFLKTFFNSIYIEFGVTVVLEYLADNLLTDSKDPVLQPVWQQRLKDQAKIIYFAVRAINDENSNEARTILRVPSEEG